MFWFFCCKFCSYVMWLCSQICDQTETQIGPFRFSDSCNLVCHPRAEKQGVAAAVGGTEPPDFCPLILPKLSLLWIDARKWRNNSLDCSRRTDNMTAQSRSMENVQCSCLSVWKGGKATVEPLPVTDQRSDFSLCPVSEGQAHKHTLTHTHRVMNRGCNDSRVCLSEHFVFHWVNSDVQCLCICVPASVCVTGKQQGMESSDQRHAEGARTHQSEEQVLTRRLPRLILAALVRRKLVSSVYHLLCVLWPFSKKSPRVTTCKHCSFYCLLSFSCFSVQQQCCQT